MPLLLDFPKRRRANRKVNILEMPSAKFIGERVVGAASFINKVFFLQWHVRNMTGSYGEKRRPLHYIHSQDGPAYTVAYWGCSLHTLSHKTTVDTSLTSRRITSSCGGRRRRRKPTVGTSRSGVPAVLSHKAGEVAFIPCSLAWRGQLPPPAALLKVELRPLGTTPLTAVLHHCSSCPQHSLWIFLYFFAPHICLLAST